MIFQYDQMLSVIHVYLFAKDKFIRDPIFIASQHAQANHALIGLPERSISDVEKYLQRCT